MRFDQLSNLAYNGYVAVPERDVYLAPTAPSHTTDQKGTIRGNLAIAQPLGGQRTLTFTSVDKALDPGTGVWIPYIAQRNVWGFLKAGHTWAASGPFSGCHFEIGVCGGRIYAAHLAREAPNDRNIASWANVPELAGKNVLYSGKAGVFNPNPNHLLGGTAVIIVADINPLTFALSITRIEAYVRNAGGMNGRMAAVTRVV